MAGVMTEELWPALPLEAWSGTYRSLHMWAQIVGKIALAKAPPLNHSWAVALQVTPRGLATRMLPHGQRSFTMQFDFIDHELVIRTADGESGRIALRPRTIADFYREVMATLEKMGLSVRIWPVAVEVPTAIRLDADSEGGAYDAAYAQRFWRILVQIERVFSRAQCGFVGKCSPVHFFWGSFDLAVTRFSGRAAPPREGPAFMRDAYSHEVISHGFWPGSGPVSEPAFYAYAVPEPPGFKDAKVRPDAAFYHREMGEFILPYEVVRRSVAPERALQAFIDSTYASAADLANWDRQSLDRHLSAAHLVT
jgi:hypothetical protein